MDVGSIARTALGSGSSARAAFWIPGLTIGAVAAAATVGPSLFPHDPKFQAAAIGGAGLAGFAVGAGIEGIARGAGKISPGARMGALGVLAGAGLVAWGATRMFGDKDSNIQGLGTAGVVTAAAAGASIAATIIARKVPNHGTLAQLALPVIAGGGVLGMAIHDRMRTDKDYLLPDVDLPKVDPSKQLATRELTKFTAAEAMPGVDPSTVQLDKLPPNGLRFMLERPTAAEITATMGEPAKAEPLRLYVGLDEAPAELALPENEPKLVDWMTDRAMERMEASGAFDRSRILVAATTSTGFINPLAPVSNEMMTLGDVATVGMQAGHKKAMFEMDNLDRATAMHEMLLAKIQDRIAACPRASARSSTSTARASVRGRARTRSRARAWTRWPPPASRTRCTPDRPRTAPSARKCRTTLVHSTCAARSRRRSSAARRRPIRA